LQNENGLIIDHFRLKMLVPSSHTVVVDDRAFFACVRVYGLCHAFQTIMRVFGVKWPFRGCTARQGIKSSRRNGLEGKESKTSKSADPAISTTCLLGTQKLKNKIPTTCAWQQQRLRISIKKRLRIHNIGFFTLFGRLLQSSSALGE
jgi:hypothetical protein